MLRPTTASIKSKIRTIIATKRNYAKNAKYYLQFMVDKNMLKDYRIAQFYNKFHVSLVFNNGKKDNITLLISTHIKDHIHAQNRK